MRKVQDQTLISRYLAQLDVELRSVPESQRELLMADIAEHIDEARLEGRSVERILDGLGPAEQIALALNIDEYITPINASSHVADALLKRRRHLLGFVALFLGVLAAIVLEWLNPLLIEGFSAETSPLNVQDDEIVIGFGGAGTALLFLIPGLLVAVGTSFPKNVGRIYSPVFAIAVTVLAKILDLELGLFYLPLVVVAWLIACAWLISARSWGKIWRIVFQVIIILMLLMPVAVTSAGILSGAILVDVIPLLAIAVSVVCLVGVVRNARWVYWCMALIGVLALVGAIFSMGMLVLGIWIAGTIYLSCGLIGLLWMNPMRWLSRSV